MFIKNLRHIKPFSKSWFKVWQIFLLMVVNFPDKSIREIIRYKLGIVLDRNILINQLYPNSFRISIGSNQYQHIFYSKNIFARSLHFEFISLWKLIHRWDMNFANRFMPTFNLGFDTLTSYTEAYPEDYLCDGRLTGWTTATTIALLKERSGDALTTYQTIAYPGLYADSMETDMFDGIFRAFFNFDTSDIGIEMSVSNVEISLWYAYKTIELGDDSAVFCDCDISDPVVMSDYSSYGSTSYGSISSVADLTLDQYTATTLSNSCVDVSGNTPIGMCIGSDFNTNFVGTWASSKQTKPQFYTANDTSIDPIRTPKLIVIYGAGGGAYNQMII